LLLPLFGCTTAKYVQVPCPKYPKPEAVIPQAGELSKDLDAIFDPPSSDSKPGTSQP